MSAARKKRPNMELGAEPVDATEPITVLLVEDHTLMAEALVSRIARIGMHVVHVARNITETVHAYGRHRPDLVLSDVGLRNGDSGVAGVRTLLGQYPGARVLMYSGYVDAPTIQASMSSGAVGYVSKLASASELSECITAAVEGGVEVYDRVVYTALLEARRVTAGHGRTTPGVPEFTGREAEILNAMMVGLLTTQQLAERFFIAPTTVKTHMGRIFDKLGVSNRASAVARAYELGLGEDAVPSRLKL